MMRTRIGLLAFGLLTAAIAADEATLNLGKKEEANSCLPCHSLRLIHSQRLARAAWVKELDKMAGWGAVMKDRDALLEYLVANYGNDKPLPVPDMTADGSRK
jgi:hypothetical protein